MQRAIFILAAALSLAACQKATDTAIPSEVATWDKELAPAVQKLSPEERALFTAYIVRAKMGEVFGGKGVPPGTTIGMAIEDQRRFAEQKAKEEAEAKALAEKIKKERAAAMEQMRQAVTVALVEKSVEVERGYSGMEMDRKLWVRFAYKNNSDKVIAGVKGTITINDLFGDRISAFAISNDDTIPPGASKVWAGSRSIKFAVGNYNKDEKLADLPPEKYSLQWEPAAVVFADGTKLTAPE